MIVGLSIRTHIAPSIWALEEPEAVLTALELLDEIDRRNR